MNEKFLKVAYTFFLSVIIALFVGFGISTFYPGPEMPDVVSSVEFGEPGYEQQEAEREAAWNAYDEKHDQYSANVTVIALAASVFLLGVSLWGSLKNRVIANGILIGGLFTLIYAMGRGFETGDSKLSFATVTVGLIAVLYLGHRRFFPPKADDPQPMQQGTQD